MKRRAMCSAFQRAVRASSRPPKPRLGISFTPSRTHQGNSFPASSKYSRRWLLTDFGSRSRGKVSIKRKSCTLSASWSMVQFIKRSSNQPGDRK